MERQVMPLQVRETFLRQKNYHALLILLYIQQQQRVKIEEFMCVYVFESELKKENFNDN